MRYATITADPGRDGFYPESRTFLDSAEITDERVHYVDVSADGTIVGRYELHGDNGKIRAGVERLPTVLNYDVVRFFHEPESVLFAERSIPPTWKVSLTATNYSFQFQA